LTGDEGVKIERAQDPVHALPKKDFTEGYLPQTTRLTGKVREKERAMKG